MNMDNEPRKPQQPEKKEPEVFRISISTLTKPRT